MCRRVSRVDGHRRPGYSQPQRSHRRVAGLLGGNRIYLEGIGLMKAGKGEWVTGILTHWKHKQASRRRRFDSFVGKAPRRLQLAPGICLWYILIQSLRAACNKAALFWSLFSDRARPRRPARRPAGEMKLNKYFIPTSWDYNFISKEFSIKLLAF
ncbi:hypothetical protein EVAR_32581_1 [Eumeta japonica]|uniref:Uncharacterized protein n=1 Tax=Eumeta variegata TaxID=151549 RepID=A0A4C1VPS9_EUMVA|nr:hypothetical protein EVAR_32581_1 [Eumeta japonica]